MKHGNAKAGNRKCRITAVKRKVRVAFKKETNLDLPPNQNINKFADEVYGDTKIPRRKHPKL